MTMLTRTFAFFTRPRRAAVISSAAGRPVSARRGTVLVLILGALAIISIVTLLYFTVGRLDARTGGQALDHHRVENAVQGIADYFNDVVSRSTLATFVDGTDAAATQTASQILIRKTWDYPYTDPFRRSVTPANLTRRFDATGSYSDANPNLQLDERRPYEPWLSTAMPTKLVPAAAANPKPYNLDLDWLHISNFAPDGRFVNLYNLCPNVGGQRVSRFDLPPVRINSNGIPQGPTQPNPDMSWGLTLLGASGVSNTAGAPQPLPNGLGNADTNVPAHWTMWQQQAFRLAKVDPNFGPGSPEYAPYQWVDTDGDGFLDARWFELVDATNPNSLVSFLPRDDRFRWFVAARAVDLTGRVNVNTGMDQRQPAMQSSGSTLTLVAKLGQYPDVDLYRLVRMDDTYQIYGFGYDALQDDPSRLPEYYNQFYTLARAREIGEMGYNALRLALRREGVAVVPDYADLRTSAAIPAMTGDDRANEYLRSASSSSGTYFAVNDKRIALPPRFNMTDLLELLTRNGTNDPAVTSRLEQAMGGRFNPNTTNPAGNVNEGTLGPMRDARTLGGEIGTNDYDGDGRADDAALAKAMFDIRQHETTDSGGRQLVSGVTPAPGTNTPVGKLIATDVPVDAVAAAWKIGGTTAANAATSRDPSMLFRGYAAALNPYSWRTNFWSTNYARYRTLSYGNNPELAIRFAGHLAANMGDSFDVDGQQSGYTLLLDKSQRTQLPTNTTNYPWWAQGSGKLDLTDALLPDSTQGATVSSPAINIFGIEAQPFITQVCSFVILTDAPQAAGGDNENQNAIPPNEPPITISPAFDDMSQGSAPNTDFLGQVLGFQLTNPFDVPIPLSDSSHTQNYQSLNDGSFSAFYLEYNSKLFKLARDNAGQLEGVILRPGETRTFYVLSSSLADMEARLASVAGTVNPLPPNAMEQFIDNQLAIRAFPQVYTYSNDLVQNNGRVKPIRLRQMDPTTGTSQPAVGDLFAGTDITAKRNVYLWRVDDSVPQNAAAGRSKHILADRLFDPMANGQATPTLDRMAPAGSGSNVNNTRAGPEASPIGDDPPPPGAIDNTGFTIALWGTIKRPDNPVATPIGAIPAYCLEAKWSSGNLQNFAETDTAVPGSLDRNNFDTTSGQPPNADITVKRFFNKTMLSTAAVLPPNNNPGMFPGVLVTANGTYATMTAPAHLKRHGPHFIGNNADNRAFVDPANAGQNLYPRIALDNKRFEAQLGVQPPAATISTMRIADLLLPLAIGPEFDPGPNPPAIAQGQSVQVDRCMTLSQALALALHYSDPPAAGDPFSVYYNVGSNASPMAGQLSSGALDRGHLSLDRFTPFEDANNNGTYEPSQDKGRWPGIPLALNILNTFRTIDPQFGSLTRLTPGQINPNTAPLPVLRTLPLLSPTTDQSSLPGTSGQTAWSVYLTLSGVTGGQPPLPLTNTDIAAAVKAYRDKTVEYTRPSTSPPAPPAPADFRDTTVDPFGPGPGDGRAVTTQNAAIRETPGIASIGELMAITSKPGQQLTRLRATDRMDTLGTDSRRSGTKGTISVLSYNTNQQITTTTLKVEDEIVDDYAEKLLIAQGLANSVNVRSDVFAIWFVVHGYQRSDTENLGPADPLVPSIAKRFVMVLDRSNVTRAGEKAKVLLFKEVPLQ